MATMSISNICDGGIRIYGALSMNNSEKCYICVERLAINLQIINLRTVQSAP